MMGYSSLRSVVLAKTGQDVSRCCSCALCDEYTEDEGDVGIALLMQWILANDARALTSATVWSDEVLQQVDQTCASRLDIPAVLRALRAEARQRRLR